MIKDEKDLQRQSRITALYLLAIFTVVGLILKNISLPLGYGLGFLFSYIILLIDCQSAGLLVGARVSKASVLQGTFFLLKMGIYTIGFLIAVKIPGLINIFCVAIGYLNVKLTIFRLTMARR